MQTESYSNLLELIEGLAGVDAFTVDEQAKVLGFVNRRLYQAYNRCQVWPRYIVAAQARPGTDGLIPETFTPATNTISSATRDETTVTVVCSADVDFVVGMFVTIDGVTGTVDPEGSYQITSVDDETFEYELDAGTGTETYTIGTGTAIADAIPAIDGYNRIWEEDPKNLNSAREYEFWVDSDGAHVIGNYQGLDGFWVGYRKRWPGPYTTAAVDIPLEFYHYAAHAAYADFLRMDQQTDKARMEEAIADEYLMVELDRAQIQKNFNNVYGRIQTHLSNQSR